MLWVETTVRSIPASLAALWEPPRRTLSALLKDPSASTPSPPSTAMVMTSIDTEETTSPTTATYAIRSSPPSKTTSIEGPVPSAGR